MPNSYGKQVDLSEVTEAIAELNNLSTGDIDARLTAFDPSTADDVVAAVAAIKEEVDANETKIDEVKTDTGNIRTVDVVALSAEHVDLDNVMDAVGVIVADIHDTDLPAQNIGAIKVRGDRSEGTYEDLLDYAGMGTLNEIEFKMTGEGSSNIRVTIDANPAMILAISEIEVRRVIRKSDNLNDAFLDSVVSSENQNLDLKFKSRLRVEMAGTGVESIYVGVIYSK